MTYKFAVFGNPIEQSKSPQIHLQFAQQFNIPIDYQKILSTDEHFAKHLQEFFDGGGDGCNVTAPFKEQAFDHCKVVSTAAQKARAVNTIYLDDKKQLCGHNSDGAGLVNDLIENQQLALQDSHIIVLGAGGATRGILEPIIAQHPASILVANRTLEKAVRLATEFADQYDIQTTSTDKPKYSKSPDLLINATSASLTASLPVTDTDIIGSSTVCYDLAYKSEQTAFLKWASECGAGKTIDGRGMLAEQAAISFQMWTHQQPDTTSIIQWLAKN